MIAVARVAFAVSCFTTIGSAPQILAAGQTEQITITSGRPLAAIALELERRHGWIVTYEDPPYEFEGDVDDVTGIVRRDFSRPNLKVLVPRAKSFTFEYGNGREEVNAARVLPTLLEEYHRTFSTVSTFRLLQTGDVFHVVPQASAGRDGNPVNRRAALNTRISIEDSERNGLDLLQEIAKAVSRGSETPIELGTIPVNLFVGTRIRGGARDEVARSVLLRTLSATGVRLSWRLLCQPGLRQCALNVHAVKVTGGL